MKIFKYVPVDSQHWSTTSLHSKVSWRPIFLPGCSLLGSFPLPPLTRGPCLAPAGMSSCTHTWSSAHWGPCWTACTCTPNLWWICMNTHRGTRIKMHFYQLERKKNMVRAAEICWKGRFICAEWFKRNTSEQCENIFWRHPSSLELQHCSPSFI